MKKIFAIAFVLLMAGFTLAQHVDVVQQTGGNDNEAYVDQGFMDVGPAHPGNEAYVYQIGSRNLSDVDQYNGGYAGDEHEAFVKSQGSDNYVQVFQNRSNGSADVQQYGNWNWGQVYQNGNGMDGTVYSEGNNNIAQERMWGTSVSGSVIQVGNDNKSYQFLGSALGEKVENSDFASTQYGSRNYTYQKMDGDGFAGTITALNNHGVVNTTGSDNTAYQYMLEGSADAANNTATATQTGNWNYSMQHQVNAGNVSTHLQIGNGDIAVTNQN